VAVVRELIRSFPEDIVGARSDPSARDRAARAFAECGRPDFETAMVAPDGWTAESSGVDGFFGSFGEWTEGFERFRVDAGELIEEQEAVVVLADQHGVPKGAGAEIVTESAAVFFFADSLIERVEFHLDRGRALRAAGID
jgi:hypothetical protein